MTLEEKIKELYKDHAQMPYISPERNLETWLESPKPVPKRNMERLEEGLLAGDIILLWRISFGTFTNESTFPKYCEYTYGIDAPKNLQILIEEGYVEIESAFDSLNHLSAPLKKNLLKEKEVKGLSKMKVAQLDQSLFQVYTEAELAKKFTIRGYQLTEAGHKALTNNQEVINRHPQKKF